MSKSALAMVTIIVTALLVQLCSSAVPISEFFPCGPENGDTSLPKGDGLVKYRTLMYAPLRLFGVTHTEVGLNENGDLFLGSSYPIMYPTCDKTASHLPKIAVFWADVDTTLTGAVFYRESIDSALLLRVKCKVNQYFGIDFMPTSVFIVTWWEITYTSLDGPPPAPRNSFQLVLANNGIKSFAILLYNKLEWTAIEGCVKHKHRGDCSTGNANRLAVAGFDPGDGSTFYPLPLSCTPGALGIVDESNTGNLGEFIFEVDTNLDPPPSYFINSTKAPPPECVEFN